MRLFYSVSILLFCFFITSTATAQKLAAYPSNWWVDMQNPSVQIMLHGEGIGKFNKVNFKYPGVTLEKVHVVENSNYLFVDIKVSATAMPGTIQIECYKDALKQTIPFELKPRRPFKGKTYAQGVDSKDFIYLILPDRFSNGDESNDRIVGMRDQSLRRDTVYNRHGGDLKGIENHLDYLFDMGVTTIWLNPVWENNMPTRTEHGYAFTDHYNVDPRLGGNKAYFELVKAAHSKGMKIIQDAVYNHVGLYHFTVQDIPMKDWLHQWDKYTNTSFKDQTLFDPYVSKKENKQMSDGWFTPEMPDLNQNNPYVANFLIQHAIWSVEEFGIDGWRIDTYAYNDLAFMNRCNKALMDEYPNLTLFGETWVYGVPNQSYFCENNYNIPYKSNLQAVTDFQCLWAITETMNKDFGWNDGVSRLYTTLAQDFVYKNPNNNVIFLDNHDISRFYSVIGENIDKYKSAICWLLTARGIPQLYYSSEFATTGVTSPNDGYVRLDFPGGWKSDSINKFTISGRTQKDQSIFQDLSNLALFRKKSSALTTGKFMQYIPNDGLYVYFRYDEKQTIMVVMNTSKSKKTIHPGNYEERVNNFKNFTNVITKVQAPLTDFELESNQTVVLELNP